MGYRTRIPQVIALASLRTQRAVETAGQQIEFEARARARKDSGDMAAGIEWQPARDGQSGRVRGRDFKTRWHEFGTRRGLSAQPMLGPAADEAEPPFVQDMSRIFDR